jgi:hypothetical protein
MKAQLSRVALIVAIAILVVPVFARSATVTVTMPANLGNDAHDLVLRVDDLKLPPNASGIVRVFAEYPDANPTSSTEDERFLGYFTVMAKDSAEAARGVQRPSVSLDVSHKKNFLAGKQTVTLTLVSLGRGAGTTAAGHDHLTFSRVYFSRD